MAMLFMEVYDLAVLTFMFVRDKNTEIECNNAFGPNSQQIKDCDANIANNDNLNDVLTPEQREMIKMKLREGINKLSIKKGQVADAED